jgi:hypothetical protein
LSGVTGRVCAGAERLCLTMAAASERIGAATLVGSKKQLVSRSVV